MSVTLLYIAWPEQVSQPTCTDALLAKHYICHATCNCICYNMLDAAVVFHRMFYTLGAGSCCVVCMQRYYVVCFFLVVFFFFVCRECRPFQVKSASGCCKRRRSTCVYDFWAQQHPVRVSWIGRYMAWDLSLGFFDYTLFLLRQRRYYIIWCHRRVGLFYLVISFFIFFFFSFIVVCIIISAATDGAKSYRQWAEIHISFMVCCFFFLASFFFLLLKLVPKSRGVLH